MATRVKSIEFYNDSDGGTGDTAGITINSLGGENRQLLIYNLNDAADEIRISAPTGYLDWNSNEAHFVRVVSGVYTGFWLRNDRVWTYGGSRGINGFVVTSSNQSIGGARRYSGYIEWSSDVGAIGTYYFLSDIRKKNNVKKSTENALNLLKNVEFISFDWNAESGNIGHVKLGFSAQQLKTLNESLVDELSDGTLMLSAPALVPYFGKAIQEQQQQIESQQKTIESLEARLKALEDLLK